jgi:Protein of unknown function (DUF3499)
MIPGTKWARRYGAYTRRTCARPGCGAPAAATLRFLPTQREAWLVDLDDAAARTEGDLCARHAAALVLPRGWQLHDERSGAEPPLTEQAPPPRPRSRARSTRAPLTALREPQPELDLHVEPTETEARQEPEPEREAEPEAEATEPRPEPRVVGEVLTDVLDARTPLLKRAFQNVWPLDAED